MPTTPQPVHTPTDVHAFIAEAERLTNSHDAVGTAAVYATEATLELVTDGAVERYEGRAAIADAWHVVLDAGSRHGFRVSKTVVAADDDTIVNRWEGSFGGRGRCRGIESWRFGSDGLVVEHRAETFLAVRPSSDLRAQLRVLVSSPRVAVALARAQRARRG